MAHCARCRQALPEEDLYCYGHEVYCNPCFDHRCANPAGMDIEFYRTERGFVRGEFKDYYAEDCSIQESSVATAPCLWLGRNNDRIHLSKDAAVTLIEVLQKFVRDGDLSDCLPKTWYTKDQ